MREQQLKEDAARERAQLKVDEKHLIKSKRQRLDKVAQLTEELSRAVTELKADEEVLDYIEECLSITDDKTFLETLYRDNQKLQRLNDL